MNSVFILPPTASSTPKQEKWFCVFLLFHKHTDVFKVGCLKYNSLPRLLKLDMTHEQYVYCEVATKHRG